MENKISNKNKLEKKCSFLEIKSLDKIGRFSGYASVFNIEDSYKDIVIAGAFKNTLKTKNITSDIKLLWQHNQTKPIGYFNLIKEDTIGLYVEGQIMLEVQQGLEAYNLIKSKAVNGLSIGYSVKKFDFNKVKKNRILKEVELFEISIVTFPANEYANITFCKSKNLEETIAEKIKMLETFLNIRHC